MNPNTHSPTTAETQLEEKEAWTPPVLQKMDIEETAFGIGPRFDGDGKS